jgi:hypothetical protein
MKERCRFHGRHSFRFRRAIRIGCAARRDRRTGHVAAYGDGTAFRLHAGSITGDFASGDFPGGKK